MAHLSLFVLFKYRTRKGIASVNPSQDEKVQKKIKQLKGLKFNQKTEEQLQLQAEALVSEKEQLKAIDIESRFTDTEDQKQAKELLKKYLADYSIETVSDKNTLCHLIFLEIVHLRLQDDLNEAKQKTKAISPVTVELIHKNLEQISKTKTLLGITKNAKDQAKQDGYAQLQLIKKKYKKWLAENQGSRTLWCPHCAKATLLKIKMDVWESQKHPYFKDRILGNEHLISLFQEGKVTRVDLAKIFEVSPDYIDWLVVKGWKLLSDAEEKKLQVEEGQKEITDQIKE